MDAEVVTLGARRRGRPPKLSSDEVEQLVALVRANPTSSLDDLVWGFRKTTGITLAAVTLQKYLHRASFERVGRRAPEPTERQDADPPKPVDETPARTYRYSEAHRDPGHAERYPCGLTDSEWEHVRHVFDPPGRTGRPPRYERRRMLDACIYVLRSGCAWRMLPKDLPPWPAVYRTFRRWLARGLFDALYDELRALWRQRERRDGDPTVVIVDSQSVATSPQVGPKGYDAAKKVKGRKRHLVTDTLGLVVAVLVTAAHVQDRDAALPVVERAVAKVPGLQKVYADSAYAGRAATQLRVTLGLDVEIMRHPGNRNVGRWQEGQLPLFDPTPKGFVVLPKRWVIERTNAWDDQSPPDEQGPRPPPRRVDRMDLAGRRTPTATTGRDRYSIILVCQHPH